MFNRNRPPRKVRQILAEVDQQHRSARNEELQLSHTELQVFRESSLETHKLPLDALVPGDILTLWLGYKGVDYGGMMQDRRLKLRRVGPFENTFLVEYDSLYARFDHHSKYAFVPNYLVFINGANDSNDLAKGVVDPDNIVRGEPLQFTYGDTVLSTGQTELLQMTVNQAQIERPGLQPSYMFTGDEYSGFNPTEPDIKFA